MKFIRIFLHTGSIYPSVWQEPLGEAMKRITENGKAASKVLEETGADHVIYATKEYDEADEVKEIDLYMIPLSDEEFRKRTDAWQKINKGIIYATHKI